MADTKLADLTALTAPSGDDLLYVVDDPAGTPSDKKLALDNLFTRGTVTVSSPVINAAQTWNAVGTTFTGLKFNATDTASAVGSLLMDLQVGGSSRFSVSKSGTVTTPGSFVAATDTYWGRFLYASTATGVIGFNAGDLVLSRRGAANLRFGAADAATASVAAQTLSVQSVAAGNTDGAGKNLTITGSQGTGNAAGGSIIFQVAPAGSSGTAQNALATALTINSDSVFGTHYAAFTNRASAVEWMTTSGSNRLSTLSGSGLFLSLDKYIGFTGSANATTSVDLILIRDAANTLAQRNGAAAQALRVYNTYTDATTFERANIFWDSNVLKIGTEKGSVGGTARNVELQFDSTTQITLKSGETIVGAGAQPLITLGHSAANTSARIGFNSGIQFVNSTLGGGAALRISNGALGDVGGIQFGGTTSSFPALKRSSASLQVRLADDSADAALSASTLTSTASTANTSAIAASGYSLSGSSAVSMVDLAGTWDTTGVPTLIKANVTNTASGAGALLLDLQKGTTSQFKVDKDGNTTTTGSVTTAAPAGGTAAAWKLGAVASVSPTSPDRTIEVDIGGTIYYLAAKTTND
jgi:hypothetical protein